MKQIVAIGGYAYQNPKNHQFNTPIEIDKEIISLSGKKKPKVLFVPTASTDSEKYVEMIKDLYEKQLGCFYDDLLLYAEKPSKKQIHSKIDWADIIYVGGGNTLKMMKKWRFLGIDKMLKSAYKQGKLLCGVSAGSICWFEYGVSDSLHFYNKKETKYIKVRGLGVLSSVHCPHFKSKTPSNKHRFKGLQEIMRRSKGKCVAVPDGSALVFKDGKMIPIGLKKSSWCWWEKGQWKEQLI